MQKTGERQDLTHELWLIYCLLKDAEANPDACVQQINSARLQLGCVVNTLNRYQLLPKSARVEDGACDETA